MNSSLYRLIESALELDPSVSLEDKETILACCRTPFKFRIQANQPTDRLLTIKQAHELLNVSRSTLWRMARDGLPHIMIRDTPRFRQSDLVAIIDGIKPNCEATDGFTTLYKGKKGT